MIVFSVTERSRKSSFFRNPEDIPKNTSCRYGCTGTCSLDDQRVFTIGFRIDFYNRIRAFYLSKGTFLGNGNQFYIQYPFLLLKIAM